MMNRTMLFCILCATATSAWAAKPCDELKAEIAAKLDAKHAAGYSLQVVSASDEGTGTVVGTCEGGTKKILYSRGAANAKTGTAAQAEGDDSKK